MGRFLQHSIELGFYGFKLLVELVQPAEQQFSPPFLDPVERLLEELVEGLRSPWCALARSH